MTGLTTPQSAKYLARRARCLHGRDVRANRAMAMTEPSKTTAESDHDGTMAGLIRPGWLTFTRRTLALHHDHRRYGHMLPKVMEWCTVLRDCATMMIACGIMTVVA